MEIVYVYTKERRRFGRRCNFQDKPAELIVDIPPNLELSSEFIDKNPNHIGIQSVKEMSEHEVNTERVTTQNIGVLHSEGGWPRDVDARDTEHTIRYRRKIQKTDEFVSSVKGLTDVCEHYLRQNNTIDIYEEYFSNSHNDHSAETPSARALTVFRDPAPTKRWATNISWHPDGAHKLAISYSVMQFQHMTPDMSIKSYIWDVENPNYPDQEIQPTSQLCCLEYNSKDPHILVGGSYNGLISFWDTRKGALPVDTSLIERSHRDPVYNVKWIQSKTGTECFSCSTDGQVLWWDIRKLGEPTDSLQLEKGGSSNMNNAIAAAAGASSGGGGGGGGGGVGGIGGGGNGSGGMGGVCLDYDPSLPTKFMIGTEQGVVLSCTRKAKGPGDRIVAQYPGHHGPVYALSRNPFFPKYFLTVGDWTARIWNEDIKTPVMLTKYHMSYLTDGAWSTSRPGVFITTRMDGVLDIWDLLYKQNEPILEIKVADTGLTSLKIQEQGKFLAVGGQDGSTTLMQLCDGLHMIQNSEKTSISQMLDRETKREKNLESRSKDIKNKQNNSAGGNNNNNNNKSIHNSNNSNGNNTNNNTNTNNNINGDKMDAVTEEILKQVEAEFWSKVKDTTSSSVD